MNIHCSVFPIYIFYKVLIHSRLDFFWFACDGSKPPTKESLVIFIDFYDIHCIYIYIYVYVYVHLCSIAITPAMGTTPSGNIQPAGFQMGKFIWTGCKNIFFVGHTHTHTWKNIKVRLTKPDIQSSCWIPSGKLTWLLENGHRNSGFTHLKMVIFYSHVRNDQRLPFRHASSQTDLEALHSNQCKDGLFLSQRFLWWKMVKSLGFRLVGLDPLRNLGRSRWEKTCCQKGKFQSVM